jgi:uncharacterized protein
VIVDCHMHVWPDAIAKRALAQPSGDLERIGDGTQAGALAALDAGGIDRGVLFGIGNTADRVEAANRFVGSLQGERFIGFGSIHPGLPVEENIEGLRRHGLPGTKIHPLFQGFALDDPGLYEILDALQQTGIAAIIHVGHGGSGSERCTPQMLVDLIDRFPRLKLIACHFGGYRMLDVVEELILGRPVYVDTSWPPGIGSVDPARVRRMIERHGADRVIYGSDWPMAEPAADVAAIRALGLSDADTDAVLGGNLLRILEVAS